MKKARLEVIAEHSPYSGELNVWLVGHGSDGRFSHAKPVEIEFEVQADHDTAIGREIEPTFRINRMWSSEFLQAMADCCEKAGVRPSQKPVLENELTATKYHLEDMRNLVFKPQNPPS